MDAEGVFTAEQGGVHVGGAAWQRALSQRDSLALRSEHNRVGSTHRAAQWGCQRLEQSEKGGSVT